MSTRSGRVRGALLHVLLGSDLASAASLCPHSTTPQKLWHLVTCCCCFPRRPVASNYNGDSYRSTRPIHERQQHPQQVQQQQQWQQRQDQQQQRQEQQQQRWQQQLQLRQQLQQQQQQAVRKQFFNNRGPQPNQPAVINPRMAANAANNNTNNNKRGRAVVMASTRATAYEQAANKRPRAQPALDVEDYEDEGLEDDVGDEGGEDEELALPDEDGDDYLDGGEDGDAEEEELGAESEPEDYQDEGGEDGDAEEEETVQHGSHPAPRRHTDYGSYDSRPTARPASNTSAPAPQQQQRVPPPRPGQAQQQQRRAGSGSAPPPSQQLRAPLVDSRGRAPSEARPRSDGHHSSDAGRQVPKEAAYKDASRGRAPTDSRSLKTTTTDGYAMGRSGRAGYEAAYRDEDFGGGQARDYAASAAAAAPGRAYARTAYADTAPAATRYEQQQQQRTGREADVRVPVGYRARSRSPVYGNSRTEEAYRRQGAMIAPAEMYGRTMDRREVEGGGGAGGGRPRRSTACPPGGATPTATESAGGPSTSWGRSSNASAAGTTTATVT